MTEAPGGPRSRPVALLPEDEYHAIYARVPRLCVEVIVTNPEGAVYLTKRAHEPCSGLWHLPGGTVLFGEFLVEAVARVARRELSIDVRRAESRGLIEYPSHFQNGLDSPVGVAFEVLEYLGEPTYDEGASDGGWFATLPEPMHPDQDSFLLERGYVSSQREP